jgi:hypothetical protein
VTCSPARTSIDGAEASRSRSCVQVRQGAPDPPAVPHRKRTGAPPGEFEGDRPAGSILQHRVQDCRVRGVSLAPIQGGSIVRLHQRHRRCAASAGPGKRRAAGRRFPAGKDAQTRRSAERVATSLLALIGFGDSISPCVVTDFNDGGARLRVSPTKPLPVRFQLRLSRAGTTHIADLRWRTGEEAGVKFQTADLLRFPESSPAR